MKPHDIKADVDHFRMLDARVALETHELETHQTGAEAPRGAVGEMDLANSLRVLFSLFDEKGPTQPPPKG